jgi:pimeloyl-ACP methyl ester carboxylesterase
VSRLLASQIASVLCCVLLPLHGNSGPAQEVGHALPCGGPGVVFVADGSGNLHSTFDNLKQVVADTGLPVHVVAVGWSHGNGRIFSDLHGRENQHTKGRCLAADITNYRAAHPGHRICLVGHSAGAAVVLAAAEALPPGAVDRIVLLAPAVSPAYDLRPALACSCEGIDCFHSHRDTISWLLAVVGTADGSWACSAGRGGFRPAPHTAEDTLLYQRLRQHAWRREGSEAGHHGGHFGWTRCAFLRASVLPLLLGPACGAPQ